jgi:hypothetical protein
MVMDTTVKVLQGLLNARGCSIAILDPESQELVIEAAAGIDPKWVHKARMKVGEGISGQAFSERRPIYVRDTWEHPDFLFFDDVLRSLIAVPLMCRDEVIGALTVDSDSPKACEDSDIQLMTIAAAQVSTAIANAKLYEEAEDRAAKLAVAYEELQENDRLKDELVQNVSHELRTPLTFVKGYVDLLMDGEMGLINQEQQNTLQIVSDKTVEITRLIDDIMSLQRRHRQRVPERRCHRRSHRSGHALSHHGAVAAGGWHGRHGQHGDHRGQRESVSLDLGAHEYHVQRQSEPGARGGTLRGRAAAGRAVRHDRRCPAA